jgi:asparagine synthase (glutamine-hydrolysing)
MCGICGSTSDAAGSAVSAMNRAMVHRGPDDEGRHVDPRAGIALGARRLSIIDVEGGHQPIGNEDDSVWAVLNGEIYNHLQLRETLRARGHTLRTNCDTEVLVHLYEDHGDALVHALEGMFAFAIWDGRRRRLLVGRDRFGEKPLFYSERGGVLTFASELVALLAGLPGPRPDLDPNALHAFLVFGYVPAPRAMIEGVRVLPPGHLLHWDQDRETLQAREYWRLPAVGGWAAEPAEELVREVRPLLERSVRSRMIADVPLGVFLSGGLDSTLVTALAVAAATSRVVSFTVGYDVGDVNELEPARAVARHLGTEHHEVVISQSDVATEVPALMRRIDQPIADPALPALHLLCRFARQRVTVAVGGEGADELFGGYPRYRWLVRADRVGRVLPPALGAPAARVLRARLSGRARRLADVVEPKTLIERHLDWVTDRRCHWAPRLYGPALCAQSSGGRLAEELRSLAGSSIDAEVAGTFMRLDQRHWLPDDVLAKADRASMLASLELRTPFLHHELAELAAAISARRHVAGHGKSVLRGVLGDLDGLALRPRHKTAFRAPIGDWLRDPLAPALGGQIQRGSVFAEGWLNRSEVARLAAEHAGGRADHSGRLWPILCLGLWLDRFRGADGG